jgi:Activator of Hsp90 ATPase homolog 1-like protein
VAAPATVTVHECEAPRRLVVDFPESATRSWRLELDLAPAGSGTALVFTQDLVDGLSRPDVEAGWNWYLDRMEASLHATPMPDWADYAPAAH